MTTQHTPTPMKHKVFLFDTEGRPHLKGFFFIDVDRPVLNLLGIDSIILTYVKGEGMVYIRSSDAEACRRWNKPIRTPQIPGLGQH